MDPTENLSRTFQGLRAHLHATATRILGSPSEADDAVQETWIRLQRSDVRDVNNLPGWLTTVVARVCLDALRARRTRAEDHRDGVTDIAGVDDPERRALATDATVTAMLLVLETLAPAERVAFMMHDVFALPFDDIAQRVGRTPAATRQLASRARRRMETSGPHGDDAVNTSRADQRVVADFLSALRSGDVEALVAVLDPELVVTADPATTRSGAPSEVRGARTWAKGAVTAAALARFSHVARVDGAPGLVTVMGGRLARVLAFTVMGEKVARIEVIGDPARIGEMDLGAVESAQEG